MRLDYEDDGPGPVVVLLHGFPFDRSMWSNQQSSLGSVYRVISPDLRGHGSSAAPDGVYPIDVMADDVIETLDSLQLTQPVVFGGLSMGGYLALSIVTRHPSRVRGLILMNTRASADSSEAAQIREKLALQLESDGKVEALIAGMIPKLFSRKTFAQNPELVARLHQRMIKTPVRALIGTLRGLASRPDRTSKLPEISVPTLVIAGLEDQLIPLEETKAMAHLIPDARLVTVPDSGHLAPLENPHPTDQAILEFLSGIGY
ncbi:alpha/beta fold hydrolase [Tundrisphaera lichenicola]|uniref:alpha/beta fold hydrolase n=1 Tax=Tundrisphaera lichenicola TaxID=2029860 RepID=UPI003EC090FA